MTVACWAGVPGSESSEDCGLESIGKFDGSGSRSHRPSELRESRALKRGRRGASVPVKGSRRAHSIAAAREDRA